jgi:hypothetical protein
MNDIEFMATFGHVRKAVKLSQPMGGASGYQLFIDNFYHGMIVKLNGEWVGHLGREPTISGDDIGVLGEIIEGLK